MSNKKQHHEEHPDESWLVPYADVLTLLLALFIVMFAMGQTDREKLRQMGRQFNIIFAGGAGVFKQDNTKYSIDIDNLNSAGDAKQEIGKEANSRNQKMIEKEALKNQLQKMIDEENKSLAQIKKDLEAEIKNQGLADKIKVILTKDALEISIQEIILFRSGDDVVLNNISPILSTIGKFIKGIDNNIKIVGHTDNVPISGGKFRNNWELSVSRAVKTMEYLSTTSGIDQKRFTVQGNGEFLPKENNSTEEGRAKNRRVEIFIMRMHPLSELMEAEQKEAMQMETQKNDAQNAETQKTETNGKEAQKPEEKKP